ncbi:hypothetical protein ACUOAQ_17855, partial [Escherichia sp. SP-MK]
MKFPGKRKSKHYFPVNARDPLLQQFHPEGIFHFKVVEIAARTAYTIFFKQ